MSTQLQLEGLFAGKQKYKQMVQKKNTESAGPETEINIKAASGERRPQ